MPEVDQLMTAPTMVAEQGLPGPGVGGLYVVQVSERLVKVGYSSNLAGRLVSHHRSLRHLGVEFVAAWVACPRPAAAERDLLARLAASGFDRVEGSESFEVTFPVALRFATAAAARQEAV
jgi:hypothetical protein